MKSKLHLFQLRILSNSRNNQESGAMLIMAYLSIIMFLLIAVLMLDVPYMERIGRSMQSNLDTASLSGAIQLSLRWSMEPGPDTISGTADDTINNNERLRGWRRSKRAVFAALAANPISSAESLDFDANTSTKLGLEDPMDPTSYGYEKYIITGSGGITGDLTITRGVYHRPNNFVGNAITTFYRTEYDLDPNTTWWADDGTSFPTRYRCIARTSPDSPLHVDQLGRQHPNEPTECLSSYNPDLSPAPAIPDPAIPNPANPPSPPGLPGQSVLRVADSVQVTLTINNVPTLFGKLLGIGGVGGVATYNSITRTAVSVPE